MTVKADGIKQVIIDYQGMEITDVSQWRQSDDSFVHIGKNCTTYNDQALGSALIIQLLESKEILFYHFSCECGNKYHSFYWV